MATSLNQSARRAAERGLLVQVIIGRQCKDSAADSLAELERLADTAGVVVTGSITQRRDRPDPAFLIGHGKLEEVQLACRAAKADLLVFDNDLSAVQVDNLSAAVGADVMDRTELILQIFARRARSAEAQMQVELAQLQYLSSRIQATEKQARFRGGIGARGPGEKPFQLHKAPMLHRIRVLKQKLELIQKRRARTREGRPWPVVSIVGYTNAGKSTLLNALTRAGAHVDDRLFATLDTKSRLLFMPGGRKAILTDTVGFIRHLPHGLVASFRSTLEEISESDMLLVVSDAGHAYASEHASVVRETLREMGADRIPALWVFNKVDCGEASARMPRLAAEYPEALFVSALTGEGLDALKLRIEAGLPVSERPFVEGGNDSWREWRVRPGAAAGCSKKPQAG